MEELGFLVNTLMVEEHGFFQEILHENSQKNSGNSENVQLRKTQLGLKQKKWQLLVLFLVVPGSWSSVGTVFLI
ncbi:unnamed protein product [Amaranthus hypochondriacus]